MGVRYEPEKLKKVITDFYQLTGISVAVTDTELRPLVKVWDPQNEFCAMVQSTEKGKQLCHDSDRALFERCRATGTPVTHTCHAGLTDTIVPIRQDGTVLGYILFGQRRGTEPLEISFDKSCGGEDGLELDPVLLAEAYGKLRFLDRETLDSAAEIVGILAKYIWLEHMIRPTGDDAFARVTEHIDSHPGEDLTVETLCKKFHLTKNVLYREFRAAYGCTVNGYVTEKRLKYASELLATTRMPVYEISAAVGMENDYYFCRLFKKHMGQTPLQYRKNHTENANLLPGKGEK